jgi:hypothetical protein
MFGFRKIGLSLNTVESLIKLQFGVSQRIQSQIFLENQKNLSWSRLPCIPSFVHLYRLFLDQTLRELINLTGLYTKVKPHIHLSLNKHGQLYLKQRTNIYVR